MFVCDGKIIDNRIKIINEKGIISEKELKVVAQELKDYLLYVEGINMSSYDNSDDERASCHSSKYPFGHHYELNVIENSQYLLRIDGKIVGVVFRVNTDYYKYELEGFLFDNSVKNYVSMGYSASHSSSYTDIEKVSLVRRGVNGAPSEGRRINFIQHKMSPSI